MQIAWAPRISFSAIDSARPASAIQRRRKRPLKTYRRTAQTHTFYLYEKSEDESPDAVKIPAGEFLTKNVS